MGNKEPLAVGRATPRFDAASKVTGAERYAADYYPQDFLWVGVKRAAYPHARIQRLETTAARQLPGVMAILTHADVPGSNRLGIFEKDQPVLADTVVRHYGDAVALVVADTVEHVRQALAEIVVDYEVLPAVFSPTEALQPGAPLLHEGRPQGNILLQGEIVQGQGSEALADCAYTASYHLTVGGQEHAFLETQTGVAWQRDDGGVHLVVSTQTPFRDRFELSHALGLALEKITVEAPYLGGGFGGKDGVTVQGYLALAALHSGGRPVKIWYTREESLLAGTKRHPAQLHYTAGCDQEGRLQALECRLVFDTGAYASLGGEIVTLAMEHAGGPYRIPHVTVRGQAVYTNNPVSGAFRGFGVTQVTAAMEQVIDQLAAQVGFDPLTFRRKNAVHRGDNLPTGVVLTESTGLQASLEAAAASPLWQHRHSWQAAAPAFKKRGIGMAALLHGMGFGPVIPDNANAKLELRLDGCIVVYAGVADMGQGNISTYLQLAGQVLCQSSDDLVVVLPETGKTLPSGSSSASRTTFTFGNAVVGAARQLRDRLLDKAAMLFTFQTLASVAPEELMLVPGGVKHLSSGRVVPLSMLAGMLDAAERTVVYSYTCPVHKQVMTTGTGLRLHGYPHRFFAYGVQVAALEVDLLTGEVTVCDFLSCIDGGRVLNPPVYGQQVQGGAVQGMGYALFEEFVVRAGQIATKDFSTYILPTSMDVPDMQVQAVELEEPEGPYGMKGIGEIVINGAVPAVANALAAATGIRLAQQPFTAERVLAALARQGGGL